MSKRMRANLLLTVTVLIWGTAFVAQKVGGGIGAFTFGAVRMAIGGLVLTPIALITRKARVFGSDEEKKKRKKDNIIGGICCGIALFFATTLQQFGINYTTVSKAGFITALYVIFVPLAGLFFGRRVNRRTWLCVGLAVVGFYFLCLFGGSFKIELGDFLTLLCALGFTAHILTIDHFAPKADGITITCIQFFVVSFLNSIGMILTEDPSIHVIMTAYFPILYTGVISCGIAYTFQTIAQRDAEPTQASLIMSMEAVVSSVAGAIILNEKLTLIQYMACLFILAATIIANLPEKQSRIS